MDTFERHSFWEVLIKGHQRPVLATDVLKVCGDNVQAHDSPLIKAKIAQSLADTPNYPFLACAECGNPLIFRKGGINSTDHFFHSFHHVIDEEKFKLCQFYSKANSALLSNIYKGEGKWHLETKQKLALLLDNSNTVKPSSVFVEKYIFDDSHDVNVRRRPDIQFEDNVGKLWALELTRWWMNPLTIEQREAFYRKKKINLLWLFSPDCKIRNRSTWEQIMFGSNITDEQNIVDTINAPRAQCNAFTISDQAMLVSERLNQLSFEVEYPVYHFSEADNLIEANFKTDLASLNDLVTSPEHHLPYAVNTYDSLLEAKEDARRYNRSKFADLLKSLRYEYYRMRSASDLQAWSLDFSIETLRSFDALIPTGFKLSSRALSLRASLYNQYSHSKKQAVRDSMAIAIKQIRSNYYWAKSGRNCTVIESQGYLNRDLILQLPDRYRFTLKIMAMYNIVETQILKQKERKETAKQIRYLKKQYKTYRELAVPESHDLRVLAKYISGLVRDIGEQSPRLLRLARALQGEVSGLNEQYHALQASYKERGKELIYENIERVNRELYLFKTGLEQNGLTELPISNSTTGIKFKRLVNDCEKYDLPEELDVLQNMMFEYEEALYVDVMSQKYPLIQLAVTNDFDFNVDYDDEVHKLILACKAIMTGKSKGELELKYIQKGEGRLLELYVYKVACELLWVQSLQKLPSNDVLIQIRKNGGLRARRIIRALKPVIKNHSSDIQLDYANWLYSINKFSSENPKAIRY
ncbi:hypothetical protein Sps_04715 [Shewanella psychrophila]|uniref:DUF6035 domain-containing protein n=1 Tax=Shewanella psychrophila TaxID=225848 RepID=A0A1S6HWK8_9GAMM|nr:hypothetical protein [Shewanella psychrophila]AQS39798.1 hypothetical protein Sps_04715 [Shewanella psychrophila]